MKRLRTRQRFVNLSEEKMAQKQKHCKSSSPTSQAYSSHALPNCKAKTRRWFAPLRAPLRFSGRVEKWVHVQWAYSGRMYLQVPGTSAPVAERPTAVPSSASQHVHFFGRSLAYIISIIATRIQYDSRRPSTLARCSWKFENLTGNSICQAHLLFPAS